MIRPVTEDDVGDCRACWSVLCWLSALPGFSVTVLRWAGIAMSFERHTSVSFTTQNSSFPHFFRIFVNRYVFCYLMTLCRGLLYILMHVWAVVSATHTLKKVVPVGLFGFETTSPIFMTVPRNVTRVSGKTSVFWQSAIVDILELKMNHMYRSVEKM
jgi:hypothetical protein